MNSLKCPKCGTDVLNNSKYCVKCGLYLLDNQKFLDSAIEIIRTEKTDLLGDIYFVAADSVDKDAKNSLERMAKKIEYIYDVFEKRPFLHEDTRLLICKTMDKTLSEVSDLTDLQRKKIEHRAQKVAVFNWLGTYQRTLDEIKDALSELGDNGVEVDITTLDPNETVEWFLNAK